MMVIGRAKKTMEQKTRALVTNFPSHVSGYMSPYPTYSVRGRQGNMLCCYDNMLCRHDNTLCRHDNMLCRHDAVIAVSE